MSRLLLAGAAVLVMSMGVAAAQTMTSSQSTTTVTPVIVAPPAGTLSTTRTDSATSSDGTQTELDTHDLPKQQRRGGRQRDQDDHVSAGRG